MPRGPCRTDGLAWVFVSTSLTGDGMASWLGFKQRDVTTASEFWDPPFQQPPGEWREGLAWSREIPEG